jgi:ribonuclease HI
LSKQPKNKYYVVWKGHRTGIFNTWQETESHVNGYTGAQYKAFGTRLEAERAYQAGYHSHVGKPASAGKWLFSLQGPIPGSYSVDAACSGSPGRLEYRGVILETGKEFFHEGPFEHGTNNIGEFLAIVHALMWLKQKKDPGPVYSDSRIALGWVKQKTCRTQLVKDKHNAILFDLISEAVSWLRKNTFENHLLKWDTAAWGEIPADFNRK